MVGIDLEAGRGFRDVLTGGLEHLAHLMAEFVLASHEARRRFSQPASRSHFFDPVAERGGQPVYEFLLGFVSLCSGLVAGLFFRTGQVEFAASDILQRMALVIRQMGNQPFIDSVG